MIAPPGSMLANKIFRSFNLLGWRRAAIGIFTVAFVSRGAFVLVLKDGFYFPDAIDYSRVAVSLLADGEFGETYHRPSVYPLFLAGIYAILGQTILAIRMVEALFGACAAVVIALIAKRTAGEEVGALAGLLWSIYPTGIFIAGLVYPTNVATALLACAMLCMVGNAPQGLAPGSVIIGGIFFGLAALTVPVALATIIVITLWMAYWQRTRRLLLTSLFLLGVTLPLSPWTVRNFYVYDRLVIIESRLVAHLPSVGDAQKESESHKGDDKIDAISENPGAFAMRFAREFGYFWELSPHRIQMNQSSFREKMHEEDSHLVRETVFGTWWTSFVSILSAGPMLLFALVGTGAMWFQKERRRALSLLAITILSFAVGYSFFWGKIRYRIPIEPYLIILSAYGLRYIWLALTQRSARETVPVGETI